MAEIKLTTEQIESNIREVAASFAIEGIKLTEENKENMRRIGRGEATGDEVVAEILKKYKAENATA